jgi:hypothetical protein
MAAAMPAKMTLETWLGIERARWCIGMMASSLDLLGGLLPLERAVNRGEEEESTV